VAPATKVTEEEKQKRKAKTPKSKDTHQNRKKRKAKTPTKTNQKAKTPMLPPKQIDSFMTGVTCNRHRCRRLIHSLQILNDAWLDSDS
jgi:hypothetical protein